MGFKDQFLDERFTTTVIKHPPLPFFHCCEAVHLQAIFDSGNLQPRPCKVYKEDLLYLFYGKPAYKSSELSNSKLNFLMPICFIINYEAIGSMKRAVAFDSGAFDRYEEHLHESMKREEFYITPTKEAINKMVHYFFDGNDSYFSGDAKKILDAYDPIHYQIEGFHSLITSIHKTEVDDRKSSIEVQLDYSIPLKSEFIECVILPKNQAESLIIKDFFSSRSIPIIAIPNYGVASGNYYVHILEKARRHLVNKKLLNDY